MVTDCFILLCRRSSHWLRNLWWRHHFYFLSNENKNKCRHCSSSRFFLQMDRWIFSQSNPPDEIIHFTVQDTRLYDGKRIKISDSLKPLPVRETSAKTSIFVVWKQRISDVILACYTGEVLWYSVCWRGSTIDWNIFVLWWATLEWTGWSKVCPY